MKIVAMKNRRDPSRDLPNAKVFGRSQSFTVFGPWLWLPKVMGKYSGQIFGIENTIKKRLYPVYENTALVDPWIQVSPPI